MKTARFIASCAGAVALAVSVSASWADTVHTTDGSQIVGKVVRMAEGSLTIQTAFAGELTIAADQIAGLAIDEKVNVALASGDTLVGTVTAGQGGQGAVVASLVGDIPVEAGQIAAVWAEGAESPAVAAAKVAADAEIAKYKPNWSATLEGGVTKKEGNTESLEGRGRFVVRRRTSEDLLRFYAQAEYGEIDRQRNRNEYIGGVYFENNLTDRFNWYVRGELEYDEFENLDLRTTAAAGLGYYWLKKPHHELQTRAGGGYRHESYSDDTTNDDAILDLGLDYRLDIKEWAQFTHSTTYSPSVEEFGSYRLTLDTAVAVPLADSEVWKFKIGMMNEYNSDPQPGVKDLDNTYYANLVLELK